MKMKDLEKKSLEELQNMLAEARAELYEMRLKTGVGQLRDVSKVSKKRKEIARINTRLSQLTRESK